MKLIVSILFKLNCTYYWSVT